jgi:hypothetical protein
MNQWKAAAGRIVLFPATPMFSSPPSAPGLYHSVWGDDPDSFQKQANPLAPAIAIGKRGDMMAVCSIHPTRVDFSLSPATPSLGETEETEKRSFPLIEDASQLCAELLAIIGVVSSGAISGQFNRVALNVQFFALTESLAEANKALTMVIPRQHGVKIADEEDFIFQINQPFPSRTADGIKMNSITKWSVDRLQVLTFAVQTGGAQGPGLASAASIMPQQVTFTAASVSFDINNVPAENPLSAANQSSLLREALTATAQAQQEIGLNVEGFQNA